MEHPITPPPELVKEWRTAPEYATGLQKLSMVSMTTDRLQEIATQAACWGADQELEACCQWLDWQKLATHQHLIAYLRLARRPRPPSLKKQALAVIENFSFCDHLSPQDAAILRRALEALDD